MTENRLHKAADAMPVNIFNTQKTDYEKPQLFMGPEPSGLLDTLHKPYPELFRLYEELKASDWKHDEFNYSSCIEQFKTCSPSIYRMMIRTLAWQWEGDSVASKSIGDIVLPLTSCVETRVGYGRILDNECLTGDHEVLTPTGWKRIDQVTTGDKVAQWDNFSIVFVNPTAVIAKNYTGDMYRFFTDSGTVSQLTTAKHRMPVATIVPLEDRNTTEVSAVLASDVEYEGNALLPVTGKEVFKNSYQTPEEFVNFDAFFEDFLKNANDGSIISVGGFELAQHFATKLHLNNRSAKIEEESERGMWRVIVSTSSAFSDTVKKQVVPVVDEKVYCITVPSSYFMVRHNDVIGVTGNCLHSLTYSEIVRGSFENPDDILEEITSVREAHGRMSIVAQIFDEARTASLQWQMTGIRTESVEDAVFMMVVGMYMLERVQFMASFAVTFGICGLGLFEPIGAAVQSIARDEYTNHVPFGENVLKYLLSSSDWARPTMERNRERIIAAHKELALNELAWVDYLHSDGDELPGVPPEKLKDFTLFCLRGSTELFGITKEIEETLDRALPEKLPLSYMQEWIDINDKQASPQEQDNNQYLVNTVSKVSSNEVFDFDLDL